MSTTKPKSQEELSSLAGESISVHREVLKQYTFNKNISGRKYLSHKFNRTVGYTKGDEIMPEYTEEKVSKNGIVFYPEFVEYVFWLEGLPKRLLLFLIYYYVQPATNEFTFNLQVRKDFNKFSQLVSGKEYSANVLQKAIRELVTRNIVQNVGHRTYMLNPVIAGGSSIDTRRILINKYSIRLIEKSKDPELDFYLRSK